MSSADDSGEDCKATVGIEILFGIVLGTKALLCAVRHAATTERASVKRVEEVIVSMVLGASFNSEANVFVGCGSACCWRTRERQKNAKLVERSGATRSPLATSVVWFGMTWNEVADGRVKG